MQKILLTDDIVRRLPSTTLGRVHFADAIVENMRLVVAGDQKLFYFFPDLPGISGILRIGGYPETATEHAREMAARLRRAIDPTDVEVSSDGHLGQSSATWTFAGALELHIQQLHLRRHNRSAGKDAKFLERYLMDPSVNPWTLKPIGLVTDMDVLTLVMSMHDKHALARNCLSKVKTFFRWAMHPARRSEFGLTTNPVSDVTPRLLGLRSKWRHRHFNEVDISAYLKAADHLEDPLQRLFCQVLILTGQRPGDLATMHWSHLDLDRKLWNKPTHADDIYGSTGGIMPLSDATVSLLESHKRGTPSSEDPSVFGQAFTSQVMLSRLRCIIDRQMMGHIRGGRPRTPDESWRWQDLRRGVLNILIESGAPFEIARSVIESGRFPAYAPPPLLAMRTALEGLASALEGIRRTASEESRSPTIKSSDETANRPVRPAR